MSLIELIKIYLQKIEIKMNIKVDQFHRSKNVWWMCSNLLQYIISNKIINILGYDTKFITYLIQKKFLKKKKLDRYFRNKQIMQKSN
jgi:hypothetical protein